MSNKKLEFYNNDIKLAIFITGKEIRMHSENFNFILSTAEVSDKSFKHLVKTFNEEIFCRNIIKTDKQKKFYKTFIGRIILFVKRKIFQKGVVYNVSRSK